MGNDGSHAGLASSSPSACSRGCFAACSWNGSPPFMPPAVCSSSAITPASMSAAPSPPISHRCASSNGSSTASARSAVPRRCWPIYRSTPNRIAISNSRLVTFDDTSVTFGWKDYRANGRDRAKVMTLAIDEFIRRFLIHVLPGGFHRIRHYGLLANGGRADNIAQARQLLNVTAAQVEPGDTGGTGEAEPQTLSHPCPCCGGRMIIIETFQRGCPPRHRPTVPTWIDSS